MKKIIMVIIFIALLFFIYWWSQYTISVSHYVVSGPTDMKILQISDLHNNLFGKNQERIINVIKTEEPDVIVFTGDMNSRLKMDNFELLLNNIEPSIPKILVTGNHEETKKAVMLHVEELCKKFEIVWLKNDGIYLRGVNFYGIGILDAENFKNFKKFDEYTVTLVHTPLVTDELIKNEYDVVLSGHMHGGQWRIPFLREGLITPDKKLFPKYTGGLYSLSDETTLIVCRGLGTMTWIPRIFNRPEIVVVNLVKEND